MSSGIEVELKLLLESAHDHDLLRMRLQGYGNPQVVEQLNYYLDTRDRRLLRSKVMVRVRVEADQVISTCKTRPQMTDGLMSVHEFELPMPAVAAALWRQGAPDRVALDDLPIADAIRRAFGSKDPRNEVLYVLGAVRNTRRRYAVPADAIGVAPLVAGGVLEVELDHTLFPGDEERFELEVEHANASALASAVESTLLSDVIRWRPADESKYAQFLRLTSDWSGSIA